MIRPAYRGTSQSFVTNEAYEREQVRLETSPKAEDLPALCELRDRIEADIALLEQAWQPSVERSGHLEPFSGARRRALELRPHAVRLNRHIFDLEGGADKARTLARLCRVIINAEDEKNRELATLAPGQSSAAVERLSALIADTQRTMDAIEDSLNCIRTRARRSAPGAPGAPPMPPAPAEPRRRHPDGEPLAGFRGIFGPPPPRR